MMGRLALVIACCGSQVAAEFCEDVLTLHQQGATPMISLPHGTNAVTCSRSLALGGLTQLHCGWAFPYRDKVAHVAFDAGLAHLDACFEQTTPDQDVNHPDFYDLRLFRNDEFEIGLSLKDKANLQETYVFLRVAPLDARP